MTIANLEPNSENQNNCDAEQTQGDKLHLMSKKNIKITAVMVMLLVSCMLFYVRDKYKEYSLEKEIATFCLLVPLAVAEKKIIINSTATLWQKAIEARVDFSQVIRGFYDKLEVNSKNGGQGDTIGMMHDRILKLERNDSVLFSDYIEMYISYKNIEEFASNPKGNLIEYKDKIKKLYASYDSAYSKLRAKFNDKVLTDNFFHWFIKKI